MTDHQVVTFMLRYVLKPAASLHMNLLCLLQCKTRDKKSRDCCYGNWLLTYDLQVIFSVCANFGRIPSNRLGTLNQFVNTLCCSHLSTGSHALIPLSITALYFAAYGLAAEILNAPRHCRASDFKQYKQ